MTAMVGAWRQTEKQGSRTGAESLYLDPQTLGREN